MHSPCAARTRRIKDTWMKLRGGTDETVKGCTPIWRGNAVLVLRIVPSVASEKGRLVGDDRVEAGLKSLISGRVSSSP